ncbi:hypothetical protein IW140_006508 [Coemansia sp. RSA 1813]|nr:hypothetical protein EV178_002930 [Coemansia sp. RSA 1646]KAJ1765124.1 hypothetical protein LPJ74_006472 [Coemansia sp. RSA 1843]KAJ2089643.1 hypothetical protein IW138_003241 [Coemansia sp. RSA 986]KAJ2210183.1 hypothetical protein EV179_006399 [Coemansia sp. RSA 487]KAJ2561971.1 hypothetical protein IW140_006508 [Coemansia sp. RSA 1813]
MQLSRAIIIAALSTLVSANAIPIKRDDSSNGALLSSMMASLSAEFDDPEAASILLSSALSYISSELPSGQKTIQQSDLESIVSKYAPKVAPSMINDLLSSAKDAFTLVSLPASAMSELNSAFSYISKNGVGPISSIIVNALNKEAPEYKLDGDIGTATGTTEDDGSDMSGMASMDNGNSAVSAATDIASNDASSKSGSATSKSSNSSKSEESSDSTDTSGASVTKMASLMIPAVGIMAMLF